MKKTNVIRPTLLALAMACAFPAQAQKEKTECKVSVAVLSLPASIQGKLHWRATADSASTPLQLSTRYFSKHLKLPGNTIAFYDVPVAATQPDSPPPPVPLLSLTVPEGSKLTYIVLLATKDTNQKMRWRAKQFDSKDWPDDSMKLLNASTETLGIMAGKKKVSLEDGKNMDFLARDWPNSFPIKIYRHETPANLVFSSTWRVSAGRRELCFLGNDNGNLTLRALMDLDQNPAIEN